MGFSEYLSVEKCGEDMFSFTVEERHLNAHGTVHGGILYSICSEAVALYAADVEKRDGVGAEGSIHYYRPAMPGDSLSIRVIPRKSGKRMSSYLIEIRKGDDKLIADAMFTVAHTDI